MPGSRQKSRRSRDRGEKIDTKEPRSTRDIEKEAEREKERKREMEIRAFREFSIKLLLKQRKVRGSLEQFDIGAENRMPKLPSQ
jgi:hypothetical protein